eukprot:COSAG06_NODE_48618_length_330_cov_41.948052_1_plen_47_part_10
MARQSSSVYDCALWSERTVDHVSHIGYSDQLPTEPDFGELFVPLDRI